MTTMPGSTATESSVSEGDTATMSTTTATTSKAAEMPRMNSRVNRVRTSSTSWVSRETICPMRVRPKKTRSSSSR